MPMGMMGWARMNEMRNRALAASNAAFDPRRIDYGDGMLPPTTRTTPYQTVANTGTVNDSNFDRPGFTRPSPREPGSMSIGGYGFGPFSGYDPGVWNPLMPIGSQNIHGGTFGGITFGPNQSGGFGPHLVFQPGRGGGGFGGTGGQRSSGGTFSAGGAFGTSSSGSPVQKFG